MSVQTKNISQSPHESTNSETDLVFTAVNNVADQLQAIEKFIARRFDEISMEINANSQQLDMAEEGIVTRFTEILEVLKAVSYSGDGSTAANAGVELGAVVETTEQAANRILDAAERISTKIRESKAMDDEDSRVKAMASIDEDVEEIFMACSFQDLTGQRIKKTLENIRQVEERLGSALDKIGIKVDAHAEHHSAIANKIASQNEIDNLFGAHQAKKQDS